MPIMTNDIQLAREEDVLALARNLDTQLGFYSTCIDLGLAQRKALVSHDLEENQRINKQQDEISFALEKAEKRRIQITERIVYGKDKDASADTALLSGRLSIPCEKLYSRMTSAQKERIEGLRSTLKEKTGHVRDLHNTNAALIQNSRRIVQATINIIDNLAGGKERKKRTTYGAGGTINAQQKSKNNFYNRKA